MPRSAEVITRHPNNPILSAADVPYPASLVFNAGVTKYQGRYVMLFNSWSGISTKEEFERVWRSIVPGRPYPFKHSIGIAFSDDGISWEVQSGSRSMLEGDDIRYVSDPRLSVTNGKCYVCFQANTGHGIRGVIAVTEDFEEFEILDISVPDNRNMILFPELIGRRFVRLERPMPVYGRGQHEAFDMWQSESSDCRFWGRSRLVLGVEDVAFANNKVGPAAPPIKTEEGWLTTFHAVDFDESRGTNGWEPAWKMRYTAGIMLLNREEP